MSIYKDCDIRGIFGEEFGADEMRLVGRAVGRRLGGRSIVVAGDVRVSTGVIKERLMTGLLEEGAAVTDIGTAPTPVAYFAKSKACFDAYALAIVTASHNPAKYNGIKLMFGDYPPSPEEIKAIESEVMAEAEKPAVVCGDVCGSCESRDVRDLYAAHLGKLVKPVRGLKAVLDIGNGTTAGIAPEIYRRMGYDVTELFGEPDGNFPNRNPNPADFRNLDAVCAEVIRTGADFGVAFDGDGDRAVFIDNKGRPVINEKSLIMLTEHALKRRPGCDGSGLSCTSGAHPQFSIVYDQKCSKIVPEAITSMGGEAILERSGHAFIKKTFLKNGSIMAGEISGHFFFGELGYDDGIYAGLCFGEYLCERRAEAEVTLADMADAISDPHISPDLRYRVPYGKMDGVLKEIRAYYGEMGLPISTYDGVRVTLPDGWLLVRRSVTEEAMTVKIEAGSDARIDEIRRGLEVKYFIK